MLEPDLFLREKSRNITLLLVLPPDELERLLEVGVGSSDLDDELAVELHEDIVTPLEGPAHSPSHSTCSACTVFQVVEESSVWNYLLAVAGDLLFDTTSHIYTTSDRIYSLKSNIIFNY